MKKFIYKISGDEIDYFVTCETQDLALAEFIELFGSTQTIVNIEKLPLEDKNACKDFV